MQLTWHLDFHLDTCAPDSDERAQCCIPMRETSPCYLFPSKRISSSRQRDETYADDGSKYSMVDPESYVAVGSTPRHTNMALPHKYQGTSMSGYGAPCGGGAAAGKSRTIGQRIHSSSNETPVSSEAGASLYVGNRQTIRETAKRSEKPQGAETEAA